MFKPNVAASYTGIMNPPYISTPSSSRKRASLGCALGLLILLCIADKTFNRAGVHLQNVESYEE